MLEKRSIDASRKAKVTSQNQESDDEVKVETQDKVNEAAVNTGIIGKVKRES